MHFRTPNSQTPIANIHRQVWSDSPSDNSVMPQKWQIYKLIAGHFVPYYECVDLLLKEKRVQIYFQSKHVKLLFASLRQDFF